MNKAGKTLRRRSVLRDASGNILPLAAAALFVFAGLAGGAVDLSRAYKVKNKLQVACDAGTLAGRRAVTTNGFDSIALSRANSYFAVNFSDQDQQTHHTSFVPGSPDGGRTVEGRAQTTMNTVLMNIFGFADVELSTSCKATMGVGNADVTMVLDTTGSMLDTAAGTTPTGTQTSKIQDLRVAMKNFYATLANASLGSNARIRYAFVPYTQTVNVGHLLSDLNPNYLKSSNVMQSRQLTSSTASPTTSNGSSTAGSSTQYSSTQYASSSACTSARPADVTAWTNTGSPTSPVTTTSYSGSSSSNSTYKYDDVSTGQRQYTRAYTCVKSGSKYYIYYTDTTRTVTTTTRTTYSMQYAAISYNLSRYNQFNSVTTQTGTFGANVASTWQGCIEERSSTPAASFSFSPVTGMSPDVPDMDIDTAPDPGDPATQWSALWPEVSYYRTNSSGSLTTSATSVYGGYAGYGCPYQAQLLEEMTQADFGRYADSLAAGGATYHDIGMAWGARVSSPDGLWADNVTDEPANGATVSRHIVFMTDGILDTGNSLLSSWGVEYHDRRITTDGSKSQSDARHNSRFLALCEAVKAKGIRIWVVAFGTSLTTSLSTCASDQSAYTASNAAQLNTAFQEIAKQVGELRIIQ